MSATRCDYRIRAGNTTLPGLASGAPAEWFAVFDQQAAGDWWRLPSLVSLSAAPFQARLTWSAGQTSGMTALMTIARGTRTSVFARDLKIECSNLSPSDNRIAVGVPDGYAQTENQYELSGEQSVSEVEAEIPPFAKRVRVDLESTGAYGTSQLRLVDAYSNTRALMAVSDQPPQGLLLGGAHQVLILPTAKYRVVFTLHL